MTGASFCCWAALIGLCLLSLDTPDSPVLAAEPAAPMPDFSAELPRIPSKSPADALQTFHVAPGFEIQQVAAEPLITDPVAIDFDASGRMFVVDMLDYSEQAEDFLGVVRLLTDTDGDGRYDTSTNYAEKLSWPTAVACYDGGIFVGAAPSIFYFKDTDGDGKADIKQEVFTGFGRGNVQGLLNSFHWGLDNRIHGTSSTSGGAIKFLTPGLTEREPLVVNGRDFAIEPRQRTMVATSGGGQHGMSFDNWGRKFVSSNSDHAQQVMYEDRYLANNPFASVPGPRLSIAADGPQAEVYRTSPIEPWRIVRTRLRVSGAVQGIVEGGGRAAGYFTGATGITIYRGNALPADMHGVAIVGDVGSNLVHRKKLTQNGIPFVATRIDEQSELVSSNDIWFRPAQFANAPDGSLYIADVYREVIEHPASLPPEIKKHLDLTSGRDKGRIYRLVPQGFQQPAIPNLDKASGDELVALLEHPNAWHRDTAARLLYERNQSAVVPALKRLAADSQQPLARMHAMHVLQGLGALDTKVILARLDDAHPRVREHAIRLAENLAGREVSIREKLYSLATDEDLEVRYQLAFTLGTLQASGTVEPLAQLIRHDSADPWMRIALLCSVGNNTAEIFAELLKDPDYRRSSVGSAMLTALAEQVAARQAEGSVFALLQQLSTLPAEDARLAQSLVRAVGGPVTRAGNTLESFLKDDKTGALTAFRDILATAHAIAAAEDAEIPARIEAIQTLILDGYEPASKTLIPLVDNRQPQAVQAAAVATLSRFTETDVATQLIALFPGLSPALRTAATEAIFTRVDRLPLLLDAIEQQQFAAADLEPARISTLTSHPDPAIRDRAAKLLASVKLGRRQDVVDSYQESLSLPGDATRGKMTFQKICAACHRAEEVGHDLGPNLAAMKNRGAEAILLNVLDPNREVNPQFVSYTLETSDGLIFTGMLTAETASSVTLTRAEAAKDTVLRKDIEILRASGLSIMPEGMEKQLDPQMLADVIAYLLSLK